LLLHLPNAAFVAIDEEMTGISVGPPRGRPSKDLTPAQRYSDLKLAPERYSIIQLGVALYFQTPHGLDTNADGRGYNSSASSSYPPSSPVRTSTRPTAASWKSSIHTAYAVRRYNFYLFPRTDASDREAEAVRDVVLNPATVAFLHEHRMSLDLWSREGIPYTTTANARQRLEWYQKKELDMLQKEKDQSSRPVTVQETVRNRIELTRSEDKTFHARAMASLREWLDSPIPQTDHPPEPPRRGGDPPQNEEDDEGAIMEPPDPLVNCSFLLPPCNSFLRRSLYESIQKEYPALELESGGNQQIRVWRLNEAEKAERHRRLRRESWEDLIGKKLGMWRVFEALRRVCSGLELDPTSVLFATSYDQIDWDRMSQSGPETNDTSLPSGRPKPLVVHNGFMDLCFLLTHFVSPQLPDRYSDCKSLISYHFPNIYDTKILATECPCWDADSNDQNASATNLANLFQMVVCDPSFYYNHAATNSDSFSLRDDICVLAAVGSRGNVEDQEHEAAFDAYMTGAIFVGLCQRISQRTPSVQNQDFLNIIGNEEYRNMARSFYGRNKLYQMSIYTMDLEEYRPDRDPLSRGMLSESTFRVSGIDKAVTTRDIVQSLAGLGDSRGRTVNFVIVWIDDTTFLVAASYNPVPPLPIPIGSDDVPPTVETWSNDQTEAVLREHGALLFDALRVRFHGNETIVVLEDYLASLPELGIASRQAAVPKSWFHRIWSIFSTAENKKRSLDETTASSNKRHRVT
jgi:CAF1 family ribonuclease